MILSSNIFKGTSLLVLLGLAVGFSVGFQEHYGVRGSVLVGTVFPPEGHMRHIICPNTPDEAPVDGPLLFTVGSSSDCEVDGSLQEGECHHDPWLCKTWSCASVSDPPVTESESLNEFQCGYSGCGCTPCSTDADCAGIEMPPPDPLMPGIDIYANMTWKCTQKPSYYDPSDLFGASDAKMCTLVGVECTTDDHCRVNVGTPQTQVIYTL